MSFGRCTSSGRGSSTNSGFPSGAGAAQYFPRPSSARTASRNSGRSSEASRGSDSTQWEMSLDEFKRQVQNQFTVVLSWDEVRALQKLYGNPDSGTIDFAKFAVALGKSPGHGPDKARRAYNFLPKHDMEYDLRAIEEKIVHKLEDRCQVAGNYQYQWARRMLCDSSSTTAGGMNKDQLKLRLSGLLGVELSDGEIDVLVRKYANPATGRVHMQSMASRLLAPDQQDGWFFLANQLLEPVVTNRISPSARYHNRPGVETYKPMDNEFPHCLKGFKWDLDKLIAKLKLKMHENAAGVPGYQFLSGCNLFRSELPRGKGDRITSQEFRHVVEYKFGMKLDLAEVLALFNYLVPGTGDSIEIAKMVRVLVPDDYSDSWFSTRESTDMFGFQKAAPDKVVMQAKKMRVGGAWNLALIEDKIREKIHERVGGTGVYEVQAAYSLFLDGHNTGLSKKSFKAQMHDKFAVVLRDEDVDDVYEKYDPKGTGSLDVHNFVLRLISPKAEPEPWFRGRPTYEFHVLNRAPMKKDPMKAECWDRANWTFQRFETALRDKLMAKSNQDGGRFAHKSAINLLRSANPDHLDSSNLDREALKFVIFRRFDIVMDDHLLDEVFAKWDSEGTGKVSVHRIASHLLPSKHDASHHLVPKTDEQGQATRTLLGKIFGMTGRRREVINLNGSGVEDPQAQSLLERMAAGDKDDSEKFKASWQQKARVAAALAEAKKTSNCDMATNHPSNTASDTAAAASRRRNNSPLAFSGEAHTDSHNGDSTQPVGKPALPPTGKGNSKNPTRPETSSSTSSASENTYTDRGGDGSHRCSGVASREHRVIDPENVSRCSDGRGKGVGRSICSPGARHDFSAGGGSLKMLRGRERKVEAREKEARRRNEAVMNAKAAEGSASAAVTSRWQLKAGVSTKGSRAIADGNGSGDGVEEAKVGFPLKSENNESFNDVGGRPREKSHPRCVDGSPQEEVRPASHSSTACSGGVTRRRPQSGRSSRSSETLTLQARTGEEAGLIERCKALGAARRNAASAAAAEVSARRRSLTQSHTQQKSQLPWQPQPPPSQQRQCLPNPRCGGSGGAAVGAGEYRTVLRPASASSARGRPPSTSGHKRPETDNRPSKNIVAYQIDNAKANHNATQTNTCPIDDRATVTSGGRGRVPTCSQSAVPARRGGVCPRLCARSAAVSRGSDVAVAGEGYGRQEVGGLEGTSVAIEGRGDPDESRNEGNEAERGPTRGLRRPASAGVGRTGRGQGYRQRLDSAYAMQIRAMQRLQRRLSTNKNKPSGERPASGGCQGIAVGQFRSRYSGLDRFMLTRGWESTGAGQAANNRSSRFGSGVEYYG